MSTERANCIMINELLEKFAAKHLRKYFLKQWNIKHQDQLWQSNKSSGQYLVNAISDTTNSKRSVKLIKELESGNEQQWDTDTLLFVLRHPELKLLKVGRHRRKLGGSSNPNEEIELFSSIKEKFSTYKNSFSCPPPEFIDMIESIKQIARNLFGTEAEAELSEMTNEQMKRNAGKT